MNKSADEKARTWTPILLSPIAAYVIVEIIIGLGADISSLSVLHSYGLINAFESDDRRKTELAAHLASQVMIFPVALHTLLKAFLATKKPLTLKNAVQGTFLACLMIALLFIPREGPRGAPAKRKLFLTPLIERFNLAYALTEALFVFCLALGLTMLTAWLVTRLHRGFHPME